MYTRHVASIELLGVTAGVWSIGEHVKRDVYIYKETSVCTKKELWNTPVERHTLDGTQSEHDKKEPISTKRRVYIYEKWPMEYFCRKAYSRRYSLLCAIAAVSKETHIYEKRTIYTKRDLWKNPVEKDTVDTRWYCRYSLLRAIAGVWSAGDHVNTDMSMYKETYKFKLIKRPNDVQSRLLHASRRLILRYIECDNIYMTFMCDWGEVSRNSAHYWIYPEKWLFSWLFRILPGTCYCMLLMDIYIGM